MHQNTQNEFSRSTISKLIIHNIRRNNRTDNVHHTATSGREREGTVTAGETELVKNADTRRDDQPLTPRMEKEE